MIVLIVTSFSSAVTPSPTDMTRPAFEAFAGPAGVDLTIFGIMFALLEKCVQTPNPEAWTPTWEKEQWQKLHPDKPYQPPGILDCYLNYDLRNYYSDKQIQEMQAATS
jgi:hypothetical protein